MFDAMSLILGFGAGALTMIAIHLLADMQFQRKAERRADEILKKLAEVRDRR